ncbi:hypothetical protein [Glutamicibacter sp. 2E12]|uniref:hypothetical protein n=1 Tax=Glutamicibacter sp. 2E12 TaxID=3416181 RepID=UPI003CF6D9CC
MLKKIYATGVALAVSIVLAGCSTPSSSSTNSLEPATSEAPETQLDALLTGIDSGTDCPGLFPLLKAIPADTPQSEQAQAEMRNIGCFSRSSERTDAQRGAVDPDSAWIGVPGGESVDLSEACETPAARAAQVIDADAAEVLIEKTLENCSTVNEWMSALQKYPGVMGMVDGYIPSVTDLQVACINYPQSAVCKDAMKLGL